MFRNGLTAALRRSRRPILVAMHTPLVRLEPSFVCLSCRVHGLATKQRKRNESKPQAKSPTLMTAIKRLEAHVQHMERNLADEVKLRKASEEIPKGDISEEMKDQAYAALMTPQPSPAAFLPKPRTMAEQLPSRVLKRLGDGMHLAQSTTPQWGAVLTQLELNGGLESIGVGAVNRLLTCIDPPQRALVSDKFLAMMQQADISPTTMTYDLIMMAHAGMGNSSEVKALFNQLKTDGVPPTVYTYGHLLKAFSQELDVSSAAAAFREMHAAGIEPNLITYTTFIQTCLRSQEIDTAWEIFNLIKFKSTATAPDVSTYTLMVHACAQTGDAERALDLYTDMVVRRGLQPTAETYHALIHACATRKDYFTQAWKFAAEMRQAGMKLDRRTVNVLIQACGRVGELTRARLLVRHMMGYGRREFLPDCLTYQNLLRAYATYRTPSRDRHNPEKPVVEHAIFVSPENSVLRHDGQSMFEEIPFSQKSVLSSSREVLDEAATVVNWLRENKEDIADIQLLNSYLDICVNQRGFKDLKWCYFHDLENPPSVNEITNSMSSSPSTSTSNANTTIAEDVASPPESTLPKLYRNIYTYQIALEGAVKFRNLPFARQVWNDRIAFTRTADYYNTLEKTRKKLDFDAERAMIDILALKGCLNEAMERVKTLADKHEWKWAELRTLYVKAVQLEDAATARLIRRITRRD